MPILQDIQIRNIWIAGIVIHVLAAWFSVGYFHVDEHFQLLEYASYKMGHTDVSNLPWEYSAGMRPSLQVLIAYLVTSGLQFMDPFNMAFILRLLSVLIALIAIYHTGKTVFHKQNHLKLYYLIALFLWFMPYQYVRFSSENWSGIMILLSVLMVLRNKPLLYAGIFSGLAFCFRYQSAFFVMGLFLWILSIKKLSLRQACFFICGFGLIFMLGILSDYWLYGQWLLSSYRYFYINLVEGMASHYGTEPFYYYFIKVSESAVLPFGLLLIAALIFYIVKQPKSVFTWVALPFLVLHCLIAHKELRFLFPMVYFVPVFLVLLFTRFSWDHLRYGHIFKVVSWIFIILNMLLLPISSFKASNPRISLLKHLYEQEDKPVCLEQNPYLNVQWFSFYFPEKFDPKTLKVVSKPDSAGRGSLLTIPSYTSPHKDMESVYRQVPQWLEKFNYGHWLNRSNFWCIARKQ